MSDSADIPVGVSSGVGGRRTHLLGLIPDGVSGVGPMRGQRPYRAKQLLEWIYRHGATDFEEMSTLPKSLRAELREIALVYESQVVRELASSDGARKLLLRWADGGTSECVLIPDGERRTACISSQVGCPVGCTFCASGLGGLTRNLTAGQIVEQAMRVEALCRDAGGLTNVVFMGLGEPLANYGAVVQAVRTINAAWGMDIGARKITVSTVGVPKRMRQLADEGLQITLALSLHAPTDSLRRELIPWAARIPIDDLVEACRYYFDRTGREVTLEYVLLGGVNDSVGQARGLADVARRMRSNVNLIRYNPVEGLAFRRPARESAQAFVAALRDRGVKAHLRRSRGQDIEGACGQLRRRTGD